MSNMQQTTLTLEEIKDLILFCKANGVNYIEYQTLKFNIVPDVSEMKQPTTEELLFGSWMGTPGDQRKI